MVTDLDYEYVAVIDSISETFALSGESYENCHECKKRFVGST